MPERQTERAQAPAAQALAAQASNPGARLESAGAGSAPSDVAGARTPPRHTGTCVAFDFGMQRIGVAVGEASLQTAHPLKQIRTQPFESAMASITALIAEWRPVVLIVGVPSDAEGHATTSEIARRIERFTRQLRAAFNLPVERVDERYSSVEAQARMRDAAGGRRAAKASRARELDSQAALVILEQYFSEQRA